MAAFGGGSMIAALLLPRLLDFVPDRPAMLAGAALLPITLAATALLTSYGALILLWIATGLAYAVAQTPSGRLLRRSSNAENRPALFAAHFAASHACWLLCYPLAGWLGSLIGLERTSLVLASIAAAGVVAAITLWPAKDVSEVEHSHADLPPDHEHLRDHVKGRHRHVFVIDDLHPKWPG